MLVKLEIPDELAAQIGGDLSRQALEGLAVDAYRSERITKRQLRELLGLSRYQLDGFLKAHGVYEGPTYEDVQRDLADLAKAGF